jgi:hypothetical protein
MPRLRIGLSLASLVAMFLGAAPTPVEAVCVSPPGDGEATVVDVQCGILAVLWDQAGAAPAEEPPCLQGDPDRADPNCDAALTVTDVQLQITSVLGAALNPTLDADGNGCADSCEAGYEGDCCAPNGSPGCEDAECTDIVCGDDAFCCEVEWDGTCANWAAGFCSYCDSPVCGDGACHNSEECDAQFPCVADCGPCASGPCCESKPSMGCEVPACMDCVCALDSWCCTITWDGICASQAIVDCIDACPECETTCGDAVCEPGEQCDGPVECLEDCDPCPY